MNYDLSKITKEQEARLLIKSAESLKDWWVLNRAWPLIVTLDEVSRYQKGDTQLKREMRKVLARLGRQRLLAPKIMANIYDDLNKKLNQLRITKGAYSTPSEHRLVPLLKNATTKKFERSKWVGPIQLDFFLPNLRSPEKGKASFTGVAIEVDGSVHDRDFRMVRDERRDDYLKRFFDIAVLRFGTDELSHVTTVETLKGLSEMRPLNHKVKVIQRRRMAVHTLACAVKSSDFNWHYPNYLEESLAIRRNEMNELVALCKAFKGKTSFDIETGDVL